MPSFSLALLSFIIDFVRNPDDSDSRQKAKLVGELEARKCAVQLCKFIFKDFKSATETEFSNGNESLFEMPYVATLFPSILAHLPKMANADPRVWLLWSDFVSLCFMHMHIISPHIISCFRVLLNCLISLEILCQISQK